MQKRLNLFMLLFVIIAVVMTSAVRTTPVYADDGGTDPAPTETAAPAEEEETATEQAPSVEEPAPATEAPAQLPPDTAPAEIVATEPAAEQAAEGIEVLEGLPENTDVVVVNEAGEVEPLVTAEAAEIIASGDPVWCPQGQVPTPGANGCTPSYTDFASLISELVTNAYSGNGIIWVASSYNGNDNSRIVFNGTQLSTLDNLTVQGGWSGTSGDNTVGNESLADVSMVFVNWTGDITINDFDFAGAGLDITSTGNITLDNVSVSSSSGDGAALTSTGAVTVTDSDFTGNSLTGLYVDTLGSAVIDTVNANGNGIGLDIIADEGIELTDVTAASNNTGAYLDTTYGTGMLTVNSSNFDTNDWTGLHAESGSTINLNDVVASNNGTNGAYLVAQGDMSVNSSTFNTNVHFNYPEDPGLFALSNAGSLTLNNVTASDNIYGAGAVLNTSGAGRVTVNGGEFNNNNTFGVQANTESGDITLDGITASYNGIKGAYLHSSWLGNISISNSTFVENGTFGISAATADGDVTADNITEIGNHVTVYGANLATATGSVTVSNSTFTLNQDVGLDAVAGKQVTLNNVIADNNGGTDVEVFSISTGLPICEGEPVVSIEVQVNGGSFTNSGGYGLMVKPGPQGTLTFGNPSTFGNNGWGDYLLDLSTATFQDCTPKPEEPETKEPLIVDVPSSGGPTVAQDCEQYTSTILKLPNATWVEVGCPFEGFSHLEEVTQETLPGPLEEGIDLVTAISLGLTDAQGNVILNEDGTITINFVIPEDSGSRRHSILFWDETLNEGKGGWVQLPLYEFGTSFPLNPGNPDDPRTILSGVQQVGNVVTVTVDFPGVFALVTR